MMVETITGITGTDDVGTLDLISIGCFLGSNLSLGEFLRRVVGLLVIYQFDNCADVFCQVGSKKVVI